MKFILNAFQLPSLLIWCLVIVQIIAFGIAFWLTQFAGILGMSLVLAGCIWSLSLLHWIIRVACDDVVPLSKSTPRQFDKKAFWVVFSSALKLPITLALLGISLWLNRTHPTPIIFEMILVYSVAVLRLTLNGDRRSSLN